MDKGMDNIKRRLGNSEEIDDQKLADMEEQDRIDSAVKTLLKAEEIKADSLLMEKVGPELEKKKEAANMACATSIKDLRRLASQKGAEEYDEKIKKEGKG